MAEGRKVAAEVWKQMPVLPDSSPVSQYVEALGLKLAQYAPGYRWPYNFHVVAASDINAFALPGGSIFVNLGTIQAADTEAQLAGVMAHEISHVAQRHSTCNLTRQQTPGLLAGLGQLAAGIVLPGAAGTLAQQGIGLATGLSFLRMSRQAENQADLMGTDILYDAGYDPRALPQFFETIQAKYGAGGAQFLSDHPNPGNRVESVDQEIATLPPRAHFIKTSAEFTRIKKLADGMHGYTAQQISSGVWKRAGGFASGPGGAAVPAGADAAPVRLTQAQWSPAGSWKSLAGTGFSITYPGNWQAQGAGDGAILAPPGGATADGSIAYGALCGRFQPSSPGDPVAGMNELLAQLQRENPELKSGAAGDVIVNHVQGRQAEATNHAAGQQPEHDWIVALPSADGSLRYVIFVAPEADFAALRPVFEQMLKTFKVA
jgi:hypothetical protein